MGRIRLEETAILSPGNETLERVREAFQGELPEVIYPDIRAITANKVTRNKTLYPSESLMGSRDIGSGISSLLYPYPVPIIEGHRAHTGVLGGASSPVFGRVKFARFINEGSGGYVSVIPAITDPEAISQILTDRFLTVSIGVETDLINCSICGCNISAGEECEHQKGHMYFVEGKPMEAYWRIGPVYFQEISFVTIPSDTEARVLNKNVKIESLSILGGESKRSGEVILQEHVADFEHLKSMWGVSITSERKSNINKNLAVVRDQKFGVEYPLFSINENNASEVLSSIVNSTLPEKYTGGILANAVNYCESNSIAVDEQYVDLVSKYNIEPSELGKQVTISLDESNYPMLYTYIEAIQHNTEVSMEKPLDNATETVVATSAVAEASIPNKDVSSVTEAAQLNETISQLNETVSQLTEEIGVLNDKCMEISAQSHLRLANEVALLSKILNKPTTRNKSIDECTKNLAKRTAQSLEDTLYDLFQEFNGTAPIQVENVVKIENPVLTTNEANPNDTKGTVGNISESEDESVYLHYGLTPEKLEERVRELKGL